MAIPVALQNAAAETTARAAALTAQKPAIDYSRLGKF
jgi:hypothetical protein